MGFLTSLLYLPIRMCYFLKSKLKMENYRNYKNTDSENSKDMDAGLRSMVQINDFIIEKLIEMPREVRNSAIKLVASNFNSLDITEEHPEHVGFIVKDADNNDIFMEMEYFNDGDEPFFIMNMDEITSDEYLDYLNLNKTINEIEQDGNIRSSKESDC